MVRKLQAIPKPQTDFLYEKIACDLEDQIKGGNLRAGERCPSVRKICQQFNVSLATAVHALALLESRGFIEARPQSGFYVKAKLGEAFQLQSVKTSSRASVGHVETTSLIREVIAAVRDHRAVPLGAATVGADLLPGPALYRATLWAMRELGPEGLHYEMPPGNEDLRRLIALRSLSAGCKVNANEVIITTGSMEAIGLCLRAVTKPGDTIAIESPMFYGILELMAAFGLKAAEIPCDPQNGMDLNCLETTLKTRKIAACLAIPNFNNPFGCKMSDQAKKDLVGMLAKVDVPLIEDDIYGDLHHAGNQRPITAKSFDKTGNVMLCSSFSKTLSSGMRVGWVLPGKHYDQIERLKFVNTVATGTVPQAAIARFLERGGYDKHLRNLRRELCSRLQQYSLAVQKYFPPGTRISSPTGGFVLWVQMPAGVDSIKLYRRAQEQGISITPGPIFSSDPSNYRNCIRITCGTALNRIMENALKTLGREAGLLCK